MKYFLLFPGIMLILLSVALGQDNSTQTGTLTGTVIDAQTGEPLSGANILILETVMGTASNLDGGFRITNIPAGEYVVQITVIGYAARVDSVTIRPNQTTSLNAELHQTVIQSAQLVVTGAKRSVRVQESPVSISSVTSADLEMRMPSTIIEVLPLEPGVQEVGGQINIRGSSGYSRGAGSRVMVLIDGIPMLASDNGGVYWDAIPVQHIENIEILKGAGSALYGSSALGGVINVLTSPISRTPKTLMNAQGGWYPFPSHDNWQWRQDNLLSGKLHISHENRPGKLGYRLGLGYDESPGYHQNGWFKRLNIQGKVTYQPDQSTRWSTRIFLINDDHGVFTQWRSAHEPFNAPLESINDYIETGKYQFALNYSKIVSSRIAHQWRSLYYRTYFQNFLHNSDDFSTANTFRSEWQTDYQFTPSHIITVGFDGSFSNITANVWNDHTTFDGAAYIQDEFELNIRTKFNAGVRFSYSQVDEIQSNIQVNPKFSLNYKFSESWSLRSSVGRGYRVPSISERFIDTQQGLFSVKPNPDLKPEVSWTYEIGTRIEQPKWTLNVAGFYNYFEDFIEPQPDPADGRIHFDNITDAQILGGESHLKFKVPFLPVQQSFAYTYLEPADLTSDTVLAYRHRHEFVSRSDIGLVNNLVLSLEYQFRSKIERVQLFPFNPDTGADNRVPIHLWNAHLQYNLTSDFTIRASASNMFQYYYVMYERNMGSTQHLQIGISYQI